MKKHLFLLSILFTGYAQSSLANDVEILAAALIHQSQGEYMVNVKLQHQDTGWEHYADAWRVIDNEGNVLGTRTLLHPHVNEQPFTRALNNVKINDSLTTLYIEAHDKVHGWSKQKLEIDLTKMQGGKLIVKADN
jgi:hypothetical protein